jgi:hypothetical protein
MVSSITEHLTTMSPTIYERELTDKSITSDSRLNTSNEIATRPGRLLDLSYDDSLINEVGDLLIRFEVHS